MVCTIYIIHIPIWIRFCYFRVHLNFARYIGYDSSYMPSPPLGVYRPLMTYMYNNYVWAISTYRVLLT